MYTHTHIPVAANFVQNIAAATGNTSYVNTYIYIYIYICTYTYEYTYKYVCT